jgi:hypothetical protein
MCRTARVSNSLLLDFVIYGAVFEPNSDLNRAAENKKRVYSQLKLYTAFNVAVVVPFYIVRE